jgi:hypothetical protein
MNSGGVPSYFAIDKSYQTIPVGHVSHYSVIVNDPNYDFFVLAGISKNELFSNLVMKNMNIREGRAFDTNLNNLSSHFPTDKLKIITKNVSAFNTATSENLQVITSKYKDIFLKMDVGGPEYLWVLTQSQENLSRFKQMVISFHEVNNNPTKARAINKINCFKKILATHNIANIRSHQNKLTITYIRKAVPSVIKDGVQTTIEGESSSDENEIHPIFIQTNEPVVTNAVVDIIPEQISEPVAEEPVAVPEPVAIEEPVVSEPVAEPIVDPVPVLESVPDSESEPIPIADHQ